MLPEIAWSCGVNCFQRNSDLAQDLSSAGFYDTWVARDIDGSIFLPYFPSVSNPYSIQRMRLGLPFPVKCCWNGMAAMTAAPFVKHGIRIRCVASRSLASYYSSNLKHWCLSLSVCHDRNKDSTDKPDLVGC